MTVIMLLVVVLLLTMMMMIIMVMVIAVVVQPLAVWPGVVMTVTITNTMTTSVVPRHGRAEGCAGSHRPARCGDEPRFPAFA